MKLSLRHILVSFFALVSLLPSAASVRLHGIARDYSGYSLEIYRYADYITHSRELIGVVMVDSTGSFDYSFDVSEITYAFIDLSSYRAHIYLEPDVDYEVVLPPFRPRPDADRFNPFYQPENIELGIANSTGCLNEAIRNYDVFFNSVYHRNVVDMVRGRNIRKSDELISLCDSAALAQHCDHEYFKRYVNYRDVQIYATSRLRSFRNVIYSQFSNDEVAYNVPSYWDALGLIGQSFIASYVKTKQGTHLAKALDYSPVSFDDLSAAMLNDTIFFNDDVRESLLLKGIYDGFYTGYFGGGLTDTLLISATNQAKCDRSRKIAFDILQKKNRLKPGTMAPDFVLLDLDGKEHSLSDMRGKFVYLAFMHTQNYSCVKDIPALSGLQRKYRRDMLVVGIMTDEESDKLGPFFKNKKIEWTVLSYNYMQSVVLDYGVESLPTYFIIDPEGRVAVSPAPAPTENFEQAIAGEIKKYKRENSRRNPQKQRSVYDLVDYSY